MRRFWLFMNGNGRPSAERAHRDPEPAGAAARAELTQVTPEDARPHGEHESLAARVAELEAHNRVLTEAATERAQRVQDLEHALADARSQIAAIDPEHARLHGEHAWLAARVAELEPHNRLLTEAATQRARQAQDLERVLTETRIELATVAPENARLRAEREFLGGRMAELEAHNRLLTEAATERARQPQDLERLLTEARIQIATLAPENSRLQAEREFLGGRMAELEAHNRLLTETAIERAQHLQGTERVLTEVRIQAATSAAESSRLEAERAFFAGRAAELEAHNRLLTETVTEQARRGQGQAEAREPDHSLPSILFTSIPKSGTVLTQQMLARGLGLEPIALSVGAFPRYSLDPQKLDRFRQGGMVGVEHLDASPENLQILAPFVDRWVVHIRDPRSVLLSWVHHLNRLHAERHFAPYELLYVCPAPPEEFFGYSFSEQVDWNIHHFLPNVLSWTRTWVETHDSGRHKILMTTFSDILAGEEDFIFKILDFYDIPRALFRRPDTEQTIHGSHFRAGRADEWRDSFTPDQIAQTTRMVGDDLLRRFGWPLA